MLQVCTSLIGPDVSLHWGRGTYITMIMYQSLVVNVTLDQGVFNITELIIRFIPVQDLTVEDMISAFDQPHARSLQEGDLRMIKLWPLSLFDQFPLFRPPSLMRGFINDRFIFLLARFRGSEDRCFIPCYLDVEVRSLVSIISPSPGIIRWKDVHPIFWILARIETQASVALPVRSCSEHVCGCWDVRFGTIISLTSKSGRRSLLDNGLCFLWCKLG
jgi:hypothetical protein